MSQPQNLNYFIKLNLALIWIFKKSSIKSYDRKNVSSRTLVVAQLVARLLPTPEVPCLNAGTRKNIIKTCVYY